MTLYYQTGYSVEGKDGRDIDVLCGEFEYDVDPTGKDYALFLDQFRTEPAGETKETHKAIIKALADIITEFDEFTKILNKDADFIDFMTDRYRNKAYEAQEEMKWENELP